MPDFSSVRVRRDVVMLVVGAVFGMAVGAGLAIGLDDDGADTEGKARQADSTPGTEPEEPAIDPTDTEFGQLTEEAGQAGVKVRWTAEILEGPDTGTIEFDTAHRQGTTVLLYEDVRLVDDGTTILLCEPSCDKVDAEGARDSLPALARPYWEIIRLVEEITSNPQYRITGETQLESGIFERCGSYDTKAFGVVVPDNVVGVQQCVDAQRGVPLRIGLTGQQRAVGGASLTAIADADAALFQKS